MYYQQSIISLKYIFDSNSIPIFITFVIIIYPQHFSFSQLFANFNYYQLDLFINLLFVFKNPLWFKVLIISLVQLSIVMCFSL